MSPALSCHNLKLSRAGQPVLLNLSLEIYPGDIALLLGKNGAGKSTLIDTLCHLLTPEAGSCTKLNAAELGVQRQEPMMWRNATVLENLSIYRVLLNVTESRLADLLTRLSLTDLLNIPVERLSRGQCSKVSLARALLSNPKNLLLDEPTAALDDAATLTLCSIVAELAARGGFVFIATHDIARLHQIANRAIVLDDGEIIFDSREQGNLAEAWHYYQGLNR